MLANRYCENELLFLKNLNKRLLIESRVNINSLEKVQEKIFYFRKYGNLEYFKELHKNIKKKKREKNEFLYCNYDLGLKYTGSARFELYPRYIFAIDQNYRYGYISGVTSGKECFELYYKICFDVGYRKEIAYHLRYSRYKYKIYKFKYRRALFYKYRNNIINGNLHVFTKKKLSIFIIKKMGIRFHLPWGHTRTFFLKYIYRSTYDEDVYFFYHFIKMLEYRLKKNRISSYFFLTGYFYNLFSYIHTHMSSRLYFFLLYLYKKSAIFTLYWSFVFIRLFALIKYLKYMLIMCKNDNILLLIKYNNMFLKLGMMQSDENYIKLFKINNNNLLFKFELKKYQYNEFYKNLNDLFFYKTNFIQENIFLSEFSEIFEFIYECKEFLNINNEYLFFKKTDKRKQLGLLDGFIYGLKIKHEFLVHYKYLKNFDLIYSKKRIVTRKTLYDKFRRVLNFLKKWRSKVRIKKYNKGLKRIFCNNNYKKNVFKIYLILKRKRFYKYNNKYIIKLGHHKLKNFIYRYIIKFLRKKYIKTNRNRKIILLKKNYNLILKKKKLNYYRNKKNLIENIKLEFLSSYKQNKINKNINLLQCLIKKIIKRKKNVIKNKKEKRYLNAEVIQYINDYYYKKTFMDYVKLKKKKILKKKFFSYKEFLRKYFRKVLRTSIRKKLNFYCFKCIQRNKKNFSKSIDIIMNISNSIFKRKTYFNNNLNIDEMKVEDNVVSNEYFLRNQLKLQEVINKVEKNIFSYSILALKNRRHKIDYLILRNGYKDFKKENEEYENIEADPLTKTEKYKEKKYIYKDIRLNKDEEEICLNIQKRELARKKLQEKKKFVNAESKILKNYLEYMELENEDINNDMFSSVEKNKVKDYKLFLYRSYLKKPEIIKWNFFNYYWNNFNYMSIRNIKVIKKFYMENKKHRYISFDINGKKIIYLCKTNYFFRNNIINKQKVFYIGKKLARTKKFIYKRKKRMYLKIQKKILLVSRKFLKI